MTPAPSASPASDGPRAECAHARPYRCTNPLAQASLRGLTSYLSVVHSGHDQAHRRCHAHRDLHRPHRPPAPLEFAEELALISAAQSGDTAAYDALLRQYALGLRGLSQTEYARAGGLVDADETRANVLLAFVEALAACDGTCRLAAKLKVSAIRAADERHLVGDFTIPARTRQRYMQALREAPTGTDPLDTAVELGMARETFLACRDALSSRRIEDSHSMTSDEPLELAASLTPERAYGTVEDRDTVERAFAAIADDAAAEGIIRDAYGFTEAEPLPDAEIAHRRGLSRSKVQRLRAGALTAMRATLAVA